MRASAVRPEALQVRACLAALAASAFFGCARHRPAELPPPRVVPHAQWEQSPPLGHAADGTRRNLGVGEQLDFRDLTVTVLETFTDTIAASDDSVRLRLAYDGALAERVVAEGAAFNWQAHHIAIVAVYGPHELGAGLVSVEVATIESLPAAVARSSVAGGAALRLRVPHSITHITLHHSGSPEPLRPEDDVVAKLRGLQAWGARDRNWWDVPYHFLIDLSGTIYEGRDWHYTGETNTRYDPSGHFLISVIGNYDEQQPTPAQLAAIAELMAWAVTRFDVPLDRIGGHYDYAETSCPGRYLRQYLEDGTLLRMVEALTALPPSPS